MTLAAAIKLVRAYNSWRRGNDLYPQPGVKDIGRAIDHVCNAAEKQLKKKP